MALLEQQSPEAATPLFGMSPLRLEEIQAADDFLAEWLAATEAEGARPALAALAAATPALAALAEASEDENVWSPLPSMEV